TYSWSMGDGGVVSGATPTYTYNTFGNYNITLTATNNVGCAHQATYGPTNALARHVANFSASGVDGCAPFDVVFTNSSTAVNNGVPLSSFQYTFQDNGSVQNTTSVATQVSHTYYTEGSYNVQLVATDEFGCVSDPTNMIINITKPAASFSIDSFICKNEEVVTSNTTTGVNPLTFEWFVNGVSSSTDQDYSTSFIGSPNTTSSQYTYVLIATDANGCKDTVTQVVTVSTPIANADYYF